MVLEQEWFDPRASLKVLRKLSTAPGRQTAPALPAEQGSLRTHFCSMGSKRSKAGLISFSGSAVSTVVLAMAMYLPCAATL